MLAYINSQKHIKLQSESGLLDVGVAVFNSAHEQVFSSAMAEVMSGVYQAVFTPDAIGNYTVIVSSASIGKTAMQDLDVIPVAANSEDISAAVAAAIFDSGSSSAESCNEIAYSSNISNAEIVVKRGDDKRFTVPIVDGSGEPFDLTGCEARMQIRDADDNSVLISEHTTQNGGLEFFDVGGGVVDIIFIGAQTALITQDHGVSDLEIILPAADNNAVITVMEMDFNFRDEVTV